jgi:hypothetical protein
VDAGCNCGAALVSKGQRAAAAIAANPQKSDRMIAEEIGVKKDTVNRARKSTGRSQPVEDDDRPTIDKPPDHCIRSSARMIGRSSSATSS